MTRILPLSLAVLLAAGCASVASLKVTVADLMAADRAFAAAAAERGLDGWMSFYYGDSSRLVWNGPAAHGLAAIRDLDKATFEDPSVQLRWDPDDAGSLGDGLGYTRGKYQLVKQEDAGPRTLGTGSYLSIWRFVDGAWRVVLDTGVADPPETAR